MPGSYKKKIGKEGTRDDVLQLQPEHEADMAKEMSLENAGSENVAQGIFSPYNFSQNVNVAPTFLLFFGGGGVAN